MKAGFAYTLMIYTSLAPVLQAQTPAAPSIQWQESFGGSGTDVLNAIRPVSGGGCILAGRSSSGISGNKTEGNFGSQDFYLVRVNATGVKVWDKTFGSTGYDDAYGVAALSGGGFVIGGGSSSAPGNSRTAAGFGGADFWIVRTDNDGNKTGDSAFGGSGEEFILSLRETADGGLILGGYSNSPASGNKTSANQGDYDYWVVKVNSAGTMEWDKSYGGTAGDFVHTVIQTKDGGYLLTGRSQSGANGNKTSPLHGGSFGDYWVVRLNASGDKVWEQSFGGTGSDFGYGLVETSDGGFLVGGQSDSGVSGNKTTPSFGSYDYWILRLDANGNKLWEKAFGGTGNDFLYTIEAATPSGFVLGGYSFSGISGNKTVASNGDRDYWVIRINEAGGKLWEGAYGGSGGDELLTMLALPDGSFVAGGLSASAASSGNKTSTAHGGNDFWLVKLAPEWRFLPAAQTTASILQNGFRFFLSGESGQSYRIDYSTDGTSWNTLQTVSNTGSELDITDAGAAASPNRIYRAVKVP